MRKLDLQPTSFLEMSYNLTSIIQSVPISKMDG